MAGEALEQAMLADLEWKLQTAQAINNGDEECGRYLIENRERLLPKLMFKKQKYGGEMDDVVAEFIRAVHKRHLEGLPLN